MAVAAKMCGVSFGDDRNDLELDGDEVTQLTTNILRIKTTKLNFKMVNIM